jgi:hypothetical protein
VNGVTTWLTAYRHDAWRDRGSRAMNTSEIVTMIVVFGSLVAVIAEAMLCDPRVIREIAHDADGFARRPVPAPVARQVKHPAVYIAGAVASIAAAMFLI